MRIFVVGMPGYGNLGDDLISVQLAGHIVRRWPDSEIGLLHGPYSNPFVYPMSANVVIFCKPIRSALKSYWKRKAAIKDFLCQTDLILIGGGGLFQDAFSPFTIHNWVKYAFQSKVKESTLWAVGVGFGLLNTEFSRWYLRKVMSRFSIIQVRDFGSQKVIEELGYSSDVSPHIVDGTDIVAGTSLEYTPFGVRIPKDKQMLGCSIRPWPGLQFDQVVSLISSVCHEREMYAALFVFDHTEPYTPEYDYACRLAVALRRENIDNEVFCYCKDDIQVFAKAFCSVSHAIASRYHANILWQKLRTPVIPIAYYPKVRRLYEEQGGVVLPVKDLRNVSHDNPFQKLTLSKEYNLPVAEVDAHSTPIPLMKRWLIKAVSGAETVYGLRAFIGRRMKRALGLPEMLPRDK